MEKSRNIIWESTCINDTSDSEEMIKAYFIELNEIIERELSTAFATLKINSYEERKKGNINTFRRDVQQYKNKEQYFYREKLILEVIYHGLSSGTLTYKHQIIRHYLDYDEDSQHQYKFC